ncbi:MAG: hypothetical protein M3Y36_10840, partial [Actinomycetota bacterium]|nr:hypothetical protein [Actinomycetota bacterium]
MVERVSIEVRDRLDPEEARALSDVLAAAEAVDGASPINADALTDLTQHGRPGLVALIAWQPGRDRPAG